MLGLALTHSPARSLPKVLDKDMNICNGRVTNSGTHSDSCFSANFSAVIKGDRFLCDASACSRRRIMMPLCPREAGAEIASLFFSTGPANKVCLPLFFLLLF